MAGAVPSTGLPMTRLLSARRGAAMFLASVALAATPALAQDSTARRDSQPAATAPAPARQPASQPARTRQWYERISLRGYAQVRYNRLFETNERLNCAQCDRSIGRNGGIFLRRARLIFSGQVHERVAIYIQPDYATEISGTQNVLNIRDAYFDLFLDRSQRHRIRVGQSKIPFGFENLQSSQNRLPLDRHDALNSTVPNERDIGAFYYFNTQASRERFKILVDSGLKGSGDYGLFGAGPYNGQTANRPELNDNLHTVVHLTYPWRLPNGQFIETSAHAHTGRFVVPTSQRTSGVTGPVEFTDERVAGSLVIYPQPIGLAAEWNVGRGPQFDPATRSITSQRLSGGYVQAYYRARFAGQVLTPFVRWQTYEGGKKLETDARGYDLTEVEGGFEWLPIPAFELTATYVTSDRRTSDGANANNRQQGQFMRLQAQFNY